MYTNFPEGSAAIPREAPPVVINGDPIIFSKLPGRVIDRIAVYRIVVIGHVHISPRHIGGDGPWRRTAVGYINKSAGGVDGDPRWLTCP
jgi:hypothetical protein